MTRLLTILLLLSACDNSEYDLPISILDTEWYVEEEEVCLELTSDYEGFLTLDGDTWSADWEATDFNEVRLQSQVVDGAFGLMGTFTWYPESDGFYIIYDGSMLVKTVKPQQSHLEGFATEGC